jgi:hypothetical protein
MLMHWVEDYILRRKQRIFSSASKEIGPEINVDTTKYNVISRDQNTGLGYSMKFHNNCFERGKELKYLGATLTNQNYTEEEIRSRLKLGNACSHSVENLMSPTFLSKNTKINMYRTIILPVVLYGCETWSLTLREECGTWVLENKVLRRIFGPKRDEVTGNGENYIERNLIICIRHHFVWLNPEELNRLRM